MSVQILGILKKKKEYYEQFHKMPINLMTDEMDNFLKR
jgi:hypothetical protein